MHRRALGYDLRLKPTGNAAPDWSLRRRQTFLLRPEIAWPLSVDESVWDSLFRPPGYKGIGVGWPTLTVEPRDYPHQILGLWQDIRAMQACAGSQLLKAGIEIRIDLLTDTPWQTLERWEFLADYPEPMTEPEIVWESLGFDISDDLGPSGLSNCGYDEEVLEWRSRWRSALNEHGLVSRVQDAFVLRAEMDKRVEEHAPFTVFQIWQLPSYARIQ